MYLKKIFFTLLLACSISIVKAEETSTRLILIKEPSMQVSGIINSIVSKINYNIDVRVHYSNDRFTLIELAISQECYECETLTNQWYDENADRILPSDFFIAEQPFSELMGRIESIERTSIVPLFTILIILIHS